MSRYDGRDRYGDRYGSSTTRLYVGHLPSRTRTRELEDMFSRYGRVRDVDLKQDFAFVEFSDPRDADDARYNLDGRDFDGCRIVVEFAKGAPRGGAGGGGGGRGGGYGASRGYSGSSRDYGSSRDRDYGGSREYLGRGPAPGSGRCFNCGLEGHWARDCTAGDWKNKCYRCGERGHIERQCQNSPKSLKRDRSYSRSLSRSPLRHGRSRSNSRSRSYSQSRSPPRKVQRVEKGSKSPKTNNSASPPPKLRNRSQTPDDESPVQRLTSFSSRDDDRVETKEASEGLHRRSPSAVADEYPSPEANGGSPSPRGEKSPLDDGADEEDEASLRCGADEDEDEE